jgi:3-oxoacyl-[acyl-carrier protein] reductase
VDLGLAECVALILGADSPAGRYCATSLAREGVRLALAGADENLTQLAATSAAAEGSITHVIVAQAGQEDFGKGIVDSVLAKFGAVDIVVIVLPAMPPAFLDEIEGDDLIVNAWSVLVDYAAVCLHLVPGMQQGKWGRLIVVGSTEAKVLTERPADLDRMIVLGALGLQKSLSGELGPFGITANSVLYDNAIIESHDTLVSTAAAVTYLASAPAAYMDGIVITVEGDRGTGTF